MLGQELILTLTTVSKSTTLAVILLLIFSPIARASEPASTAIVPTRLIIPSIRLDSPIVPVELHTFVMNGTTYGKWEVAKNEIGWHNLTAQLGQPGNTVLAGHSDINARIFAHLRYVNVGDEIIAFSATHRQAYRYVVTQKILVQEVGVSLETRIQNARWIYPTRDERLTLITCARPGATHRLIVVAKPVQAVND